MNEDRMFADRKAAGRALAHALEHLKGSKSVVLAIPRGGVPVAAEVARALSLPLDILLSKKIGHPVNPEYAIGAVTAEDRVLNAGEHVDPLWIEAETNRIRTELQAKRQRLKGNRPDIPLRNRTVIIIDDGIATGQTLLATLPMIRRQHPARIVIAVPVAPAASLHALRSLVDELIVLHTPRHFAGVGVFYADFTQVEDAEVAALLSAVG
jgi:putative phosphoribosyl transferase